MLFGVKNIFALSGTFFIFGMLLAFTPCVLPMLPILSAVIIGLKDGTNHNPLLLATLYVVSMALTYAAFGALVASVGDGVQTIVKQDYIIIFLVFFFVFTAACFFGVARRRRFAMPGMPVVSLAVAARSLRRLPRGAVALRRRR